MAPPSSQSTKKNLLGRPWKRAVGRIGKKDLRVDADDNREVTDAVHHHKSLGRGDDAIGHVSLNGDKLPVLGTTEDLNSDQGDEQHVVATVEQYLRYVGITLLAYCCGHHFPLAYPSVRRIAEYIAVAWLTCIIIILLALYKENTQTTRRSKNSNATFCIGRQSSLLSPQQQQLQLRNTISDDDNVETDDEDDNVGNPTTPLATSQSCDQPHPSLDAIYIIDTSNGRRFIPNSMEPFTLDNHLFYGRMLTMLRTPDVNDDTAPKGTKEHSELFVPYFANKQRRFEFQWQIRLKCKPNGKVFFACELDGTFKMGVLQRAFVSAALAFVKKMSQSFSYSITGSDDEKPHMAFAVENGMLRIIVTKPGETPPNLGDDLVEDPDHLKRRLKTGVVDWNTEDTYTMSMYSSYFDFLEWKSLNFPAIKPFGLVSVVGPQPIHLTLYVLPDGNEKHSQSQMEVCTDLEISNSNVIEVGAAAKQWINLHTNRSNSIFRDVNHVATDTDSVDEDLLLEEQTIAELGGGLYIRSGDPILLEVSSPDKDIDGFVCNSGGFAVAEQNSSVIIELEKAPTKKVATDRSSLIRSGDTVMVKLLLEVPNDANAYKYLSLHRGWWLKWVNNEPQKNGFFTIHSKDTETGGQENHNSYITIGSSFELHHKTWNGFHVGVRAEESASYGGHMLGLYDSANRKDDDEEVFLGDGAEGNGDKWMLPVLFSAQLPSLPKLMTPKIDSDKCFSFEKAELVESQNELYLTTLNCSLDVPVWIEMLDRTARRRKLVYVVRVVIDNKVDEVSGQRNPTAFCRLRNGRTLAEIIRLGLVDPKKENPPKAGKERKMNRVESVSRLIDPPGIERRDSAEAIPGFVAVPLSPKRQLSTDSNNQHTPQSPEDTDQVGFLIDDDGDHASDDEFEFEQGERTPRKQTKGRKIMDQIAKSVNFDQFARSVATNTAKTGKQVVKQGKKVGVTAGKAIIAPVSRTATAIQHSKKPPTRDPKAVIVKPAVRSTKRRNENDLLAVNRTVKKFAKRNATMWLTNPSSLAGQLSPSEQSLRTTSRALNRISNAAPSSKMAKHFEDIANAQFLVPTELDRSFLRGGAFQLGVVPPDDQKRVFASLVARCVWESHWREEWLGVYEQKVVLFTLGAKQPSLQLSYVDITSVRPLELNEFSPLPGYPIVVIETAWQCYYLAFPGVEVRDEFCSKVQARKSLHGDIKDADKDLWKARFWQGFQDSVEAAASTGNQKWAKIPSGSKAMHRSVMNGRRMTFDVETLISGDDDDEFEMERVESFLSELLGLALSTTFDTVERNPASFSAFLDMTSKLRSIQLERLDLAQPSALCIFTNIYHCLLQHALLLTINGPLYKKSVGHFFRTACYEIGGDVFSLAELYHCVIRGNMSKPLSSKGPYLDIPRKSSSYSMYALIHTDPRISFVLNTGDVSCPQELPVLRTDSLEVQLQRVTAKFMERHVTIENQKRTILLPKVCDIYRNDFGSGDALSCLGFCSRFLNADMQRMLVSVMKDESAYSIKFAPYAEQYHQLLSRLDHDGIRNYHEKSANGNNTDTDGKAGNDTERERVDAEVVAESTE